MCSQFEAVVSIEKLAKYTNSIYDNQINESNFSEHVYPYSNSPVITRYNNVNKIELMSYSLIPYWSKTAKPRFSTYNARLDRKSVNNSLEREYMICLLGGFLLKNKDA